MNISFRLRIKLPSGKQRVAVLKNQVTVIGRDGSCDIKINDPEISRRHACIKLNSVSELTITDMGSSNGTYFRNSPITQETRIAPGTIIRMGNTYITVETKGGFKTESIQLAIADSEYQNPSAMLKALKKSEESKEWLLSELFNGLNSSAAGLNNLELLLNNVSDVLGAENGSITLDPRNSRSDTAVKITRDSRLCIPEDVIEMVQKKDKCYIYPSFADHGESENLLSKKGTGSAICAPISNDTVVYGSIYLDRGKKTPLFTNEDLRTLCWLARSIAFGISKDLEIQTLQRKILGLESERKRWFNVLETKGEPVTPTQNRRFQQLLFISMRVGRSDKHVLIHGKTGSGRTMIAQRIHVYSDRKNHPFVVLDCMDSPRDLLQQILFGEEEKEKVSKGLLSQAHGGTLFVRELSALPHSIQQQLASAIRQGYFSPVNSSQKIATSVRLIAATDIDKVRYGSANSFCSELISLIEETSLEIPCLSDRQEDILPMAKHFLRMFLPTNRNVMSFAPESAELMIRYGWPGNVSELKDCMRFVASVCVEEEVQIGDLPKRLRDQPAPAIPDNLNLREQMDQLEMNLIRIALDRNKNIVTRAASALGLSESTLRYRMQRLKMES